MVHQYTRISTAIVKSMQFGFLTPKSFLSVLTKSVMSSHTVIGLVQGMWEQKISNVQAVNMTP